MGRGLVRSLVQALDDESCLVRAAACRALVAVALDSGAAPGAAEAGLVGVGVAERRRRGWWYRVVAGEVLHRISRARPSTVSTACRRVNSQGALACSSAAPSARVVWMDASRKGLAVAAALQAVAGIFRNCRIAFQTGTQGAARRADEALENAAAAALIRALAGTRAGA